MFVFEMYYNRPILLAECEHLIRHMLVVEPEKRLSLRGVAKHRWLAAHQPGPGPGHYGKRLEAWTPPAEALLVTATPLSTDASEGACACHERGAARDDGADHDTILDHMLSLPGLSKDQVQQVSVVFVSADIFATAPKLVKTV